MSEKDRTNDGRGIEEDSSKNPLLEAALWYAEEKELKVTPLLPKQKNPFLDDWYHKATTDKDQIKRWWHQNPNYNVGIVTGSANGILVVDLDLKPDQGIYAYEALRDWEQENGSFPEDTWMAKTAHGGYHMFFHNDQPQGSPRDLYPGVDIRADGACVAAAPSVLEDGCQYSWEQDMESFELQPMNEAVWKFIKEGEAAKKKKHKESSTPKEIPEGQRTDRLFEMVCSMQSKGYPDEAIKAAIYAVNENNCNPPLTDKELENEVFGALDRYEKGKLISEKITPELPDKNLVARLEDLDAVNTFSWTDKGFAALYTVLFQDCSRYNTTHKAYMHYDGIRWVIDEGSMRAKINAKKMADALQAYAHSCVSLEEHFDAYRKQVGGLMRYNARETIVKDAQSNNAFKSEDLDTNHYLLNCQNVVLDLSGDKVNIMSHNADLLLSKVCNVEYDSNAECPLWEKSLDEIMEGDEEKIKYLQKIFGIALTGITREEEMYFFFGSTSRNGKSTIAETILHLMGDYGDNISPESLAAQTRDSRQASPDLAKLHGIRLVVVSEPPKRMLLDVALVKTLTGRDRITARYLYQDYISFTPVFKIIINTNYLPAVSDDTVFKSERIRVIEFNKSFGPDEQIKDLKDQLKEELSGILNWMVQGFYEYKKDGLKPPQSVIDATNEYRKDSDKIGRFFADRMEESKENVQAKLVYEEYVEWCEEVGQRPEGRNHFYAELKTKGIFKESGTINKKTVHSVVVGYQIREEDFKPLESDKELPFE